MSERFKDDPFWEGIKAAEGAQSLLDDIEQFHGTALGSGVKETPRRVVEAFREMTRGYQMDPKQILGTVFAEDHDEIIALTGIRFTSLCEHHLLPFVGRAGVAYIPKPGYVVGLSKMARLVECYACRLQLQERMTNEVADAMDWWLNPLGVAVVVEAHHSCMGCRGARQPDALMVTSAMKGVFRDKPEARAEVMALLRNGAKS